MFFLESKGFIDGPDGPDAGGAMGQGGYHRGGGAEDIEDNRDGIGEVAIWEMVDLRGG
jgi:hypothetical protein